MSSCWIENPLLRPNFAEITKKLNFYLREYKVYIEMSLFTTHCMSQANVLTTRLTVWPTSLVFRGERNGQLNFFSPYFSPSSLIFQPFLPPP